MFDRVLNTPKKAALINKTRIYLEILQSSNVLIYFICTGCNSPYIETTETCNTGAFRNLWNTHDGVFLQK